MPTRLSLVAALGLVVVVAACARPAPEPEPVMAAPVTTEPVYSGKF